MDTSWHKIDISLLLENFYSKPFCHSNSKNKFFQQCPHLPFLNNVQILASGQNSQVSLWMEDQTWILKTRAISAEGILTEYITPPTRKKNKKTCQYYRLPFSRH